MTESAEHASGLISELTEAKERAAAAVELALQAQQRLKIREEVLTLQVVVQESLKKSIEDSRERALREVERLKAELIEARARIATLMKAAGLTLTVGNVTGYCGTCNQQVGSEHICVDRRKGHGWITGTADVDAMNDAALQADEHRQEN